MQNEEFMLQLTNHTIVLMGISFMLGSLFTIFILLILDMVRLMRANQLEAQEQAAEADAAESGQVDENAAA